MLLTAQILSDETAYKFYIPHKRVRPCFCRRRRAIRFSVSLACTKLGDRLSDARDRAGLTLRELGQRAGVSWSTISAIEKGNQSATVETAERLAVALGVRASWLAFGEGRGRERAMHTDNGSRPKQPSRQRHQPTRRHTLGVDDNGQTQ